MQFDVKNTILINKIILKESAKFKSFQKYLNTFFSEFKLFNKLSVKLVQVMNENGDAKCFQIIC